jgi:hypothetical protein
LLITAAARAESTITITPPDVNAIDKCLPPPAGGKPLKLIGVENKAPDKAVGYTRQGDKAESIGVAGDLTTLVGDAVVGTLKKCGYTFSQSAATIKLRVDIDEFTGGAKNKVFVGKGESQVAISLIFFSQEEASQQTIRFDRTSTMKGFSTKKLGRLTKTLSAALADIMKSVASSPGIPVAVTDLSKLDM